MNINRLALILCTKSDEEPCRDTPCRILICTVLIISELQKTGRQTPESRGYPQNFTTTFTGKWSEKDSVPVVRTSEESTSTGAAAL